MSGREAKLRVVVDAQDNTKGVFKSLGGQLDTADRQTRNWSGSIVATTKALASMGVVAAGFLGYGVKIAADLETAEIGLTTLLGSADKARETVERLKKEAARTPFELPGLSQATQLLTSVTKDGNRSIDIILDIGEALAAMGKGQVELDRIIVNLQQIAATGKAATIDIKQFAFAGIPIYEMLAETTGKNGEALAQLIEDGGVTFDLLTKMFDEANDEGGRFFNAFVNQSGSFNQALSNMKDSFGLFLADVATNSGLFDVLVRLMIETSNVLQNYQYYVDLARQKTADLFALIDKETGLVTYLREVWAAVALEFNERLRPALAELWETLKPFEPFLVAMAQVVGFVLYGAVLGLITVLGGLSIILIRVLEAATELINFVADYFLDIWNNLTDAIAGTVGWVDALVDSLLRAVALMAQLGSKLPKFGGASTIISTLASPLSRLLNVNDAVISPKGDIITTHPDDYLIATKNPGSLGGGLTINISGNTFLDEDAAERMGDLIMRRLKMSNAI